MTDEMAEYKKEMSKLMSINQLLGVINLLKADTAKKAGGLAHKEYWLQRTQRERDSVKLERDSLKAQLAGAKLEINRLSLALRRHLENPSGKDIDPGFNLSPARDHIEIIPGEGIVIDEKGVIRTTEGRHVIKGKDKKQ